MRELKLDEARLDRLDEVLAFVDGILEELECPTKIQMQLDVAVEELYVNIAHYAYVAKNGDASVQINYDSAAREVSITFIDSGIPYNPLEKEDPDVTLPAEKRKIGGLGIYMVKKSMDAMEYRREGAYNILTIRKRLG